MSAPVSLSDGAITPPLQPGDIGRFTVREVNRIGAFLDWGMPKDLLLPFGEQTRRVQAGEEVLIALYTDDQGRYVSTMNVYPYLSTDSPYAKDDEVTGTVYETSGNFGAFVAVDDRYSALVPVKELVHPLSIGESIHARVTEVRPDGKLTLSLRDKSWKQMDTDSELLLSMLKDSGGYLPVSDSSAPERIRELMHMSKSQFKRAAGRLYKERLIIIEESGIRLTEGNK